jgi:GT2 family glycosyltransferase
LNEAIQASDAEFVCLLDSECRIAPQDWLNQLLASFDDRTAQVGPQLASLDGETIVRGLLLETRGGLAWNFDNAVRWHRRPECLEVDALPRLCVVIRRQIFSETGYFSWNSGTMEEWADAAFSNRLRALGWRSVCNRSVTAAHPALRFGLPAVAQEVTEELSR